MLSLDSPKWSELKHAYGVASDIPNLLRQLKTVPSSEDDKEPWCFLWSALAHQGDVYSASFTAVPHILQILKQAPNEVDFTYFQFPTWVEVCMKKNSVKIPSELKEPYFQALSELP